MLEIEIRLYGAFRDYSSEAWVRVEVVPGTSLPELKQVLCARLEAMQPGSHAGALLEQSVFADDSDVLPADMRLSRSQSLSLIPPVCGG